MCLSVWLKLLNIHVHYDLQSLDQRIRDCGIRALSPSDALDDTRAYNAMSKAMQLLKSQLVCTCRNSYSLSSKVIVTPHTQKYTIVAILINHNCRNTSIPNVVKIHNRCSSNHNLQSWSTTIVVIRLTNFAFFKRFLPFQYQFCIEFWHFIQFSTILASLFKT